MTNPLGHQHGGTHYKGMKIQPVEFAMANQWDAAAFSVLKYLSRHATKNGLEDVQKADHFVDLRDHFLEHVVVSEEKITMQDYIATNGFQGHTAAALMYLSRWVRLPASTGMKTVLKSYIRDLRISYGETVPDLHP